MLKSIFSQNAYDNETYETPHLISDFANEILAKGSTVNFVVTAGGSIFYKLHSDLSVKVSPELLNKKLSKFIKDSLNRTKWCCGFSLSVTNERIEQWNNDFNNCYRNIKWR